MKNHMTEREKKIKYIEENTNLYKKNQLFTRNNNNNNNNSNNRQTTMKPIMHYMCILCATTTKLIKNLHP
jgi:hypothetical protein